MITKKTLGLVCASLLGAFGPVAAQADSTEDIKGSYVDQDTATRLGGVGSYVSDADNHSAQRLQKLEARSEKYGRGRYVDSETARAMGGIGGYVTQEDYDAYMRQQAGKAEVVPPPEIVSLSDAYYFETGKATLRPEAKERIADIVAEIPADSGQQIVLNGFTDSTGSDEVNVKLSRDRAQAVCDELVLNGLPAENIVIKPWGASKPVASNDSTDGRAQNRRVELEIG